MDKKHRPAGKRSPLFADIFVEYSTMNPAMCTPLRVNLREVRFETRTVGIATKYQIQVDRKGLYPSLDRMLRIRTFFAASVLKSAFSKETKILTKKRNLHWTSGPDPVKVRIRGFVTKFAGQGHPADCGNSHSHFLSLSFLSPK